MDARYVAWIVPDRDFSELAGSQGAHFVNSEGDKCNNKYVFDADACEIAVRWASSFNHKGALYILGDEPDQRNVDPSEYLVWYNKYRAILKDVDPMCQVSICGIAQPNPTPCNWGHGLDYLNCLWQASGYNL